MTPPSSPPGVGASRGTAAPSPAANAKKKSAAALPGKFGSLWRGPAMVDIIQDDQKENERHHRLLRIVIAEAIAIAVLSGLLILGAPFFLPIYQYYAMNPQKQVMQLVPLTMPNMTNRAILSWATTSITEIMTIGFGDYEAKLGSQSPRFTADGWEAFRTAFNKQKIGEAFKQSQLVLTTVPSNTPVIVAQGVNEKHVYEWRVQMPVIMTYATNNNVTSHQRAIIDLTIIRVKPEQNPSGIGIDTWSLKN